MSQTRHEFAYDGLRRDIFAGRLEPGSKLVFAELGAAYGVSVGSLREALSRLVGQGLVRHTSQIGYSVAPLSRNDLEELTQARREIEEITLRHSVAEGDLVWESEVLATHHRLASTPMQGDDPGSAYGEEWIAAHRDFHHAILKGCANSRLIAISDQLRASAELYQRWSIPLSRGKRDIAAEHKQILDAVLARDAELATRRLDEHIARTTEVLLQSPYLIEDSL